MCVHKVNIVVMDEVTVVTVVVVAQGEWVSRQGHRTVSQLFA